MIKELNWDYKKVFRKGIFLSYLMISITLIFIYSPTNVASRKTRLIIYILGLNFAK